MGIVDSRSVTEGEVLETDVGIIGGSAAGITLAREFQGQKFRVVLLESGGDGFDLETQNLYQGENVGRSHFPLEGCRLRYYGGTTNHGSNWHIRSRSSTVDTAQRLADLERVARWVLRARPRSGGVGGLSVTISRGGRRQAEASR